MRAALDMRSCIDAMEVAFTAYSSGAAELPAVIHLDVPEHGGEIHIKAGHLHGRPVFALPGRVDSPGMVVIVPSSG